MAETRLPHRVHIRNPLSADYVRSALDYDPKTGVFRWKHRDDVPFSTNCRIVGRVAGSINTAGHRQIEIHSVPYLASYLAWLIMTGEWPVFQIDHKNTIYDDNTWRNLRTATISQNARNTKKKKTNTSGFKGVSWRKDGGYWRASIKKDGVQHRLGRFDTAEQAYAAYCEAARRLHGEFARLT